MCCDHWSNLKFIRIKFIPRVEFQPPPSVWWTISSTTKLSIKSDLVPIWPGFYPRFKYDLSMIVIYVWGFDCWELDFYCPDLLGCELLLRIEMRSLIVWLVVPLSWLVLPVFHCFLVNSFSFTYVYCMIGSLSWFLCACVEKSVWNVFWVLGLMYSNCMKILITRMKIVFWRKSSSKLYCKIYLMRFVSSQIIIVPI